VKDLFSIGKLVSFDWKFGVALQSNYCGKLNSPYVSIFLKVADENDNITHRSFELTLTQFQDFAKTFVELATSLESAK